MFKTVQKHMSLIGGLFFLAQSTMVPMASAAVFLTQNQPIYQHAATSADPIMFSDHSLAYADAISVIDKPNQDSIITKVIDNSEPTVDEVKAYVLGEIKAAGLNVRQAEALVNCESTWNYKAVNKMNRNGSNDKGLWQINSIHKNISDAEKLDYKASTKWAIAKRLADGNWSAWSCSRKIALK